MLDRNKRIKPRPERFQNCKDIFDLILTCEERVYDQVVEGKDLKLINLSSSLPHTLISPKTFTDLATALAAVAGAPAGRGAPSALTWAVRSRGVPAEYIFLKDASSGSYAGCVGIAI